MKASDKETKVTSKQGTTADSKKATSKKVEPAKIAAKPAPEKIAAKPAPEKIEGKPEPERIEAKETAPAEEKAPAKKTAAKKTAAKATSAKAAEKKTTAKAAEEKPVKASAKKTAPAKTASAEKSPISKIAVNLYIQSHGRELEQQDIIDKVKEDWAGKGNDIKKIKTLRAYIKPEEGKIYYVVNDIPDSGSIDF